MAGTFWSIKYFGPDFWPENYYGQAEEAPAGSIFANLVASGSLSGTLSVEGEAQLVSGGGGGAGAGWSAYYKRNYKPKKRRKLTEAEELLEAIEASLGSREIERKADKVVEEIPNIAAIVPMYRNEIRFPEFQAALEAAVERMKEEEEMALMMLAA